METFLTLYAIINISVATFYAGVLYHDIASSSNRIQFDDILFYFAIVIFWQAIACWLLIQVASLFYREYAIDKKAAAISSSVSDFIKRLIDRLKIFDTKK